MGKILTIATFVLCSCVSVAFYGVDAGHLGIASIGAFLGIPATVGWMVAFDAWLFWKK